MSCIIKHDVLFNITEQNVQCCIYTNGDEPSFDMVFDTMKDVELWIANIQRELLIVQVRGNENAQVNQRVKELEARISLRKVI